MKNILFYLSIIIVISYFIGCKKENDDDLNFEYPVAVGSQWTYQRIITTTNFDNDSLFQLYGINDTSTTITKITEIKNLRDSIETIVFSNGSYSGYYQVRSDGLYEIAYQNTGAGLPILPKQFTSIMIRLKNYSFTNLCEMSEVLQCNIPVLKIKSDSLIFDDPPSMVLKYPLQEGAQWNYREENNPFKIDKRVVGKETLSYNIGSFSCYHIKWMYDFDNDGIFDDDVFIDDYISKEGLIKREITVLNLIITNVNGEELGHYDYYDSYKLIEVYL